MVLVINQETFNEAVNENIAEFEMTPEEAVVDTVQQFEAQGVDLSNIIKDVMVSKPDNTNGITTAVNELCKLVKAKAPAAQFEEHLTILKNECDKGLEYRVFAGKEGAYNVLLDVLNRVTDNKEATKLCLKTIISLMTKQPDLLDDRGIQIMNAYISKEMDVEVHRLILKWAKECCVMHESNRQHIFDSNILDHLKPLIENASAPMLHDILGVLRGLVLDDDVRVEYGRSHEHARTIASDTLCSMTALLSKFKTDESLMSELMLTLTSLLVRNEYCKKVEDVGGLGLIKDVMITFYDKEKLIKQCFKLLKALAGNDEVKVHIIHKEFAPVIISTLNRHKGSVTTAGVGLGCVAALTLRCPDNSRAMFDAGVADVIVDSMKLHLDDVNVQKNGSWAIRNMVSRSRYQNEKFISLGIEEVLKRDLKKHTGCEYDIKSALRDLGCEVNLKEEWTGKGGKITTQAK